MSQTRLGLVPVRPCLFVQTKQMTVQYTCISANHLPIKPTNKTFASYRFSVHNYFPPENTVKEAHSSILKSQIERSLKTAAQKHGKQLVRKVVRTLERELADLQIVHTKLKY